MRVIALGRFIYGIILLGLGLVVFELIGKNLKSGYLNLLARWHIDAHIYYVHWLLKKVSSVNHNLLELLAVVNSFYAALAFAEAAGLLMGKRWAYWLVIVDTASFIPVEIYQLCKGFNWINLILMLYFLTTVIYLASKIRSLPRSNPGLFVSPTLKTG